MTVGSTAAVVGRRNRARQKLSAIVAPWRQRVTEHPFWTGLRDGTLPAQSLWYFAEQDARYVVPAYARALARCAAVADRDPHAALLASAAQATFGSLPRLNDELGPLAVAIGHPAPTTRDGPGPSIHAHTSFLHAASVTSLPAGVGGLLPMSWFHLFVSEVLRGPGAGGPRYAAWVEQFRAYDGFEGYIEAYLDLVDEVAERCSAEQWDQLVEWFLIGARLELAFADAAWQRLDWPV